MNNPMDKFQFQQSLMNQTQNPQSNIFDIAIQAKQNPRAFEEHIKQNNPQLYRQALQIRNSVPNPQQVVMQMIQERGINPNILKILGN